MTAQTLLVELFVEELPPKALKKLGEAFSTTLAESLKAQGLAEIGPGDCVALHTGQGNTWGNGRYKSLTSEQRAQAREQIVRWIHAYDARFGRCQWIEM